MVLQNIVLFLFIEHLDEIRILWDAHLLADRFIAESCGMDVRHLIDPERCIKKLNTLHSRYFFMFFLSSADYLKE